MSPQITIVPVGPIDQGLLSWLKERLPQEIDQNVDIVIGQGIPIPSDGYDERRHQTEGTTILDALRARPRPAGEDKADKVLGLIDADCYTNGLSFIFGQAVLNGREAFVALPRLRESYYGLPEKHDLFLTRLLKEVIHELGHTWGLAHCPDPRCVMHFSNGLRDTDIKGPGLCQECQRQLAPEQVIERIW
ncbi:MAG: archaemetzincin family Zn-dependent metalloprotease [Chloroflexi bacterium]|jgi:archaemetzincin|nr:archaemetzincin family Zn-dependent metalloprotease [Chloroflexota bacterium]